MEELSKKFPIPLNDDILFCHSKELNLDNGQPDDQEFFLPSGTDD